MSGKNTFQKWLGFEPCRKETCTDIVLHPIGQCLVSPTKFLREWQRARRDVMLRRIANIEIVETLDGRIFAYRTRDSQGWKVPYP